MKIPEREIGNILKIQRRDMADASLYYLLPVVHIESCPPLIPEPPFSTHPSRLPHHYFIKKRKAIKYKLMLTTVDKTVKNPRL